MSNGLQDYGAFIKEIKELIYRRQYEALRQVNAELIQLYWDIGAKITDRQQEKGWGKSVVDVLAKELQAEFPGVQGFSARNLWRMRNFYLEYSGESILPPMVAEISWSKNTVILEKCKDPQEREFYIRMTKRFGWTKDVLINHIENRSFEKYLLNQTNFDATVPEKYRLQAKLAVKDDYNSTSSKWVNSTVRPSWRLGWSTTSGHSSRKWAAITPLSAISTTWRWTARTTTLISCCFTGGCAA